MENYDFSGFVTKHGIRCSDGRTITRDAFKHCDGMKVPLVWNHKHDDPSDVLGHVYLEHRDEGVYGYGSFNDEDSGALAKGLVMHGDIDKLSIYANQLKQNGGDVIHGMIREVSLVHAGANPGAYIENVIRHSADGDAELLADECRIYTDEQISLYHSEEKSKEKETDPVAETKEKTVGEVLEKIVEKLDNDEQTVFYGLIGMASEADDDDDDDAAEHSDINEESEGGNVMKHNVFDQDGQQMENVLTHADQTAILELAKRPGYTFKSALKEYTEGTELAHGFETEALTELLPDFKNLTPGAPDILRPDQSWCMKVINKVHKSPFPRVRTRHADARTAELKAKGYNNREEQKKYQDTIKLIQRSFDPQTIYVRDKMHRDDILDQSDFDIVGYVWDLMKDNMYETLALATLIGDGRDDLDPDKIKIDHFRPIWLDDELYTMHRVVDIEAARASIQGTNTSLNFSEEYIYAEAIIRDTLYAREKFKGSGRPDFYCEPHLVNQMLLARDLNGRRIYADKADLARVLNVNEIVEIEQLAGKTRVDSEGKTRKLLGLFVNLADYQYGSAKGGEITKFDDFDINYNTYDYLMETRLSGALNRIESAIALEEYVEVAAG